LEKLWIAWSTHPEENVAMIEKEKLNGYTG
jgi:hypothetical protein